MTFRGFCIWTLHIYIHISDCVWPNEESHRMAWGWVNVLIYAFNIDCLQRRSDGQDVYFSETKIYLIYSNCAICQFTKKRTKQYYGISVLW